MEKVNIEKDSEMGEHDIEDSYNTLVEKEKERLKKKYPAISEVQLSKLAQLNIDEELKSKPSVKNDLKSGDLGSKNLSKTYKDMLFEEGDS